MIQKDVILSFCQACYANNECAKHTLALSMAFYHNECPLSFTMKHCLSAE